MDRGEFCTSPIAVSPPLQRGIRGGEQSPASTPSPLLYRAGRASPFGAIPGRNGAVPTLGANVVPSRQAGFCPSNSLCPARPVSPLGAAGTRSVNPR